jgi:predicted dehydrogenase
MPPYLLVAKMEAMPMIPTDFVPVDPDPGQNELAIGLLGYGFMAKAHTNAYKTIPYIFWPPAVTPRLVAIAGRTEERVAEAARRYGYAGYYTTWESLVADPRIDIFDNCSPHDSHTEPSIAALEAGKHVICEKPLALNVEDATRMLLAARASGKKHMCGFNYRFLPAVRFARDLIERGALGRIYHFRGQYLQQSLHDPEQPLRRAVRPTMRKAGSQAELGCHVVDQARFLVGEIATVSSLMPAFVPERRDPDGIPVTIEWDDAAVSAVEFANGAVGTIEATRVATGRGNSLRWEINGSRGSVAFDLERLNELEVYLKDENLADVIGPKTVLVTQADHPYGKVWWPHAHILGWEHGHINEIAHFLEAIANDTDVAPYGATFEDGYRAAVIADAIDRSARAGRKVVVDYEAGDAPAGTEHRR